MCSEIERVNEKWTRSERQMYEKCTQSELWKPGIKKTHRKHMFKKTAKASMRGHLTLVLQMWGWVINPLLPGWGTGPDENQNPRVLGFALFWLLFFPWFSVPGWFLKSQIRTVETIVYTSRFSTGKPNPCNDNIYHFHVSESLNIIFLFTGGKG